MGAIARQFVVTIAQTQTSIKDLSQTNRETDTISQIDHQRLRTETKSKPTPLWNKFKLMTLQERKTKKNVPSTVYSNGGEERSDWLSRIRHGTQ